jgi:RHS repeat-associated protein
VRENKCNWEANIQEWKECISSLTKITGMSFDNNGNSATKVDSTGTTTYNWDFENRLTSVTLPGSGGTVSFKCDPFGRRIYKSSTSGTSIFAYDGYNLIEETGATGSVVARYAQTQNIDEPLAMLRGGATSFYHADGLGSITSLSTSAGAIANTYANDSFGKLTASTGSLVNAFRYTARESDPETGLYYYRARYYDPQLGRFVSGDPIGFSDGPNLYTYVHNTPLGFKDSFGLSAGSLTKCFLKGAAGGAVGALVMGGLAVGAAALGAPVAAVTGALGILAVAGGAVLGIDVIGNIRNGNWDGLAFNLGSLVGAGVVGGVGGRALAEGINGVPSPPWSPASDFGQHYNWNLGSLLDWIGTGPNPGSAGGSAALGGAGAATAGRSTCGCQ